MDQSQVKATKDGRIHIFNNGIFNDKDKALATGSRQNTNEENRQGVYYVLNPYSGGIVSEIIGVAFTKINDLIGTHLPLSTAERTNKEILNDAREKGVPVDINSHSRGTETVTNVMQSLINDKRKNPSPGQRA